MAARACAQGQPDASRRPTTCGPARWRPPSAPRAALEEDIGAEVRRLRKSLDLTVAELGAAAGISAGMLSKIENGAISPSLATLERARQGAQRARSAALFAETEERRDCSFVKAGTGVRIERRGTKAGHLYDLLGHSLAGDVGVEPYLITLKEDAAAYTQLPPRRRGIPLHAHPARCATATPTAPT